MSFEGKVVLITGASAGIGAATGVHFASLGAQIALVARNSENLKNVQTQCIEASAKYFSKLQHLAIAADVTTDAQRIIDETIESFGRLDVLVNNAGIGGICSIETDNLMEIYDRTMNTNLRSVFLLTHLAVPHLIKTKGNIVNVSSGGSMRPASGFLPYRVSKCALDFFTRCISLELGPKGVRVNSVNPGLITTEFQRNYGMPEAILQDIQATVEATSPVRRLGTPEDIASAIAFLANEQATYITGTIFPVDGGHVNL